MKIMNFKYVGEGIQELKYFPENQRRKCFLKAVRKSYRHFGTWVGLLLFFSLGHLGAHYASAINQFVREFFSSSMRSEEFLSMGVSWVGLFALYYFQMKAIKSELMKEILPNHGLESTSAPPAAGTLETHP